MTKSIILAAAMALSLGSGVAMAQEAGGADAQNLFDGYNGFPNIVVQDTARSLRSGLGVYLVQTQHLSPDAGTAGGGDGSAGR